jgi:hypothetical protein
MVKDLLGCFLRQLSLDLVKGVKILSKDEVFLHVASKLGFLLQFFRLFNFFEQLFPGIFEESVIFISNTMPPEVKLIRNNSIEELGNSFLVRVCSEFGFLMSSEAFIEKLLNKVRILDNIASFRNPVGLDKLVVLAKSSYFGSVWFLVTLKVL